jgi:hypothetical protein
MSDTVFRWLMDNADAPIRYRVAREFLSDGTAVQKLERELLEHRAVGLWLQNLNPETPPQRPWMEHGSMDFCLENAMLKLAQLGLHGGIPQLADAAAPFLAKLDHADLPAPKRKNFTAILTANVLAAGSLETESTRGFLLESLREMQRFVESPDNALYMSAQERKTLRGIPACWKNRDHFLRPELLREYGFCYPLIYDLAGLHTLYRLCDPAVNRSIDAVILTIATDAFHTAVETGYGILPEGDGVYHSMGWDPKFPGWFSVAETLAGGGAPKLLFVAQAAAHYPAARATSWFESLLHHLDAFQTADGRYAFPAAWLAEKKGYAVLGSHLSFGENRRKPGWQEIESTFYMQLLKHPPEGAE